MQELKIAKWTLYICIFIVVTYYTAIAQHHNSIPIEYEHSEAITKEACKDTTCIFTKSRVAHHKTLIRFQSGKVDTFHNECWYMFDSNSSEDFINKILQRQRPIPQPFLIEANDAVIDSFNVGGDVRPIDKLIDSPFQQ